MLSPTFCANSAISRDSASRFVSSVFDALDGNIAGLATISDDRASRHVTRHIRAQEDDSTGNFVWRGYVSEGYALVYLFDLRLVQTPRAHLGVGPTRGDGIDIDPVRCQIDSHGFGQSQDRSFGHPVSHQTGLC